MKFNWWSYVFLMAICSCRPKPGSFTRITSGNIISVNPITHAPVGNKAPLTNINTAKTPPSVLIAFARSLIGTPYKFGSIDPKQGFDCSGFITYVFRHFGINVPRSSVDFTFVQRKIGRKRARPGDLILFTGTDSTNRTVGHMGIIVSNYRDSLVFIHSTSGKAKGVTETPLNVYYLGRYIKTIRIFPQNNQQ